MSEGTIRLGGANRLSLSITARFRVEPAPEEFHGWIIDTTAYSYLLFQDDLEYLAYHWNADGIGNGDLRSPHLHVGKRLGHADMQDVDRERIESISATHHPSGYVPFTAILRTAMRDKGAVPIRLPGETPDRAILGTDRVLAVAEDALIKSFKWHS